MSGDVAVLGGVVVAGGQAQRQGWQGAHGISVISQRAGLLIGATVSLRPPAVPELRRLPGGRP